MTVRSKEFFVDIQGFVVEDKFVLKELAILECDADPARNYCSTSETHRTHHYLFKPPFEYAKLDARDRRSALLAKCFRHGLSWESGQTEYNQYQRIIREILTAENEEPQVYLMCGMKADMFCEIT